MHHVLFVLDTWGLIGGAERHATAVIPALLDRGYAVTVLCREDQRPGISGVEVALFPELGDERLARDRRRALDALVRGIDPDLVFWSGSRNLDALETLLDLKPLVRYVHDHSLFCPSLNKVLGDGEICREPMGLACLRRYWCEDGCSCFRRGGYEHPFLDPLRALHGRERELALTRRAARVLTSSHYMLQELLRVGLRPETTSVLHYFTRSNTPDLPPGELDAATEAFLASSGDPLVLTPSRLILPDKGVDFLMSALARVTRPFRAVVAGSGPWEGWLRRKRDEEGLAERVHFAGWLSPAAIESLYARSTVVVFPSVWAEPFGLVGIEAMAHGKPLVAFWVGGVPEWLEDGVNGYLLERKDYGGMARAVDRLIGDMELAREMGRRGQAILRERFPMERHLEILEWMLQRVVFEA